MSRLEEIKSNIEYNRFGSKIALTKSEYNYLIQQAEKAEKYEETLKYCQFQLKNGDNRKHERITVTIDKALEGLKWLNLLQGDGCKRHTFNRSICRIKNRESKNDDRN